MKSEEVKKIISEARACSGLKGDVRGVFKHPGKKGHYKILFFDGSMVRLPYKTGYIWQQMYYKNPRNLYNLPLCL